MSNITDFTPYKSGVCVEMGHPINTIEWLFQINKSNENKLVFFAYDANLWACPEFSTWIDGPFKDLQIEKILDRTHNFAGEVWLDDVKIKESEKRL